MISFVSIFQKKTNIEHHQTELLIIIFVVFLAFHLFAASNELVFLNFYAEWCRFSNILAPIFNEAADKVSKKSQQRFLYEYIIKYD